jgi:hypothetical protein
MRRARRCVAAGRRAAVGRWRALAGHTHATHTLTEAKKIIHVSKVLYISIIYADYNYNLMDMQT